MNNNKTKLIEEILLDEAGVDRISEIIQEWMTSVKVQPQNMVRSRLVAETLLENICVHCDREMVSSVEMKNKFGRNSFILRYKGESYNPMESESQDSWSNYLLSNLGLLPTWNYRNGTNEIVLSVPRNKLKSEIWLLFALLTAILLGSLQSSLPSSLVSVCSDYLFTPISDVFLGLLGTFAGIMVFLSVISGVCGVGNIADFSKMGKYLIARIMFFSFLGGGICALLMIPLHSFHYGAAGEGSAIKDIMDLLLQIIPTDPISPFATGNMLQVVFIGTFVGIVMVMLSSKTAVLRDGVLQANSVILLLIDIVCRLLPLYIFTSLTLLFWDNGMGIFKSIWKPIVLCAIFSLLLMIIKILIVAIKAKVSPVLLFKKTLKGFMIGLTTASSASAFGVVLEENHKDLGVDPQLTNFGFPIMMIIHVTTMSVGFMSIMYYLAEYENVPVNAMWFVSAWILVTIITCAIPPVAGGTLVCLGVLLTQFNIPSHCLAMAGTLSILNDFSMTGTRIVISQMELVLESMHWKTLDYDKLRANE